MTKPLIQIDDLVREMTEQEYAQHLIDQQIDAELPGKDNDAE